jgi:hypothetical protein
MISANFNDASFFIEMSNVVKYAEGYLEGIHAGKPALLSKMGKTIKEVAKEFVDSMARTDPASLHHVYEWYQTGSPAARLFDIDYNVTSGGLSFNTTLSQSRSFSDGSTVPFYNKAYIMENGIPITIIPKKAGVLVFDDNGETVFTKSPIHVNAPGGKQVQGSLEETLNTFFDTYLTQSYLADSGFTMYLKSAKDFKTNISKSKSGGKSAGKQIGYNWIVKAGDKL